jgi:hypothetical protein
MKNTKLFLSCRRSLWNPLNSEWAGIHADPVSNYPKSYTEETCEENSLSTGILANRGHDVSETGSVSVFR